MDQMEIQQYVAKIKDLYAMLHSFLEDTNDEELKFEELINLIYQQEYCSHKEEFEYFLIILSRISDNHHRNIDFIKKIKQILNCFSAKINHIFSNYEIYNIFKNNKIILLYLFDSKIIQIDKEISDNIIYRTESKCNYFRHFFYPEIKQFNDLFMLDIKMAKSVMINPIFSNFDAYRHEGENHSFICSLIRKDSINEFIIFVNKFNYPLSSQIDQSIFETNSFLIKNKETTLIEYAAFFGSVQIFHYLIMNNVELKPSIWLYAIHSNNAEMIHLLEKYQISPPKRSYEKCLYEAIKCHHNNIAEYIENNLLTQTNKSEMNTSANIIHFFNHNFIQDALKHENTFFYLCEYNYFKLVDLYLKHKKIDINAILLMNTVLFFIIIYKRVLFQFFFLMLQLYI